LEVEKLRTQELKTLGSTFVILGIIFGEDQLIGYSFIGAGILLSIISALKSRKAKPQIQGTGGV